MSSAKSQLRGVGDARLAMHAISAQPVWLWSLDGTKVLWANPVGAKLFGARNAAELAAREFGAADAHRRQIAQLAHRMQVSDTTRLERLRGFGASLGGLMTCACTRLDFADGEAGLLIIAADTIAGRGMPLMERLQNLTDGIDTPIAAFARDGLFVGASDTARALLGFRNLNDAGLNDARDHALKDGRAETPIGFGRMVLQRVGSGSDVGLVALIAPGAVHPAPSEEELAAEAPHQEIEAPTPIAVSLADVVEVDPELAPAGQAHEDHHDDTHEDLFVAPQAAEPEPAATDPAPVQSIVAQPAPDALTIAPRTMPLRFVWQLDADDTFSIDDGDFKQLIGPHAAALSGRKWSDISAEFTLDPDHRFAQALATRQTWSGVTLLWPVDDGGRLAVELSGLPLQDRNRQPAGYRGFGICRDLDGMNRLIERRHAKPNDPPPNDPPPRPLSADMAQAGPVDDAIDELITPLDDNIQEPTPTEPISTNEAIPTVQPPENVVQFRPGDPKSPALSPGENSAFNELARQLSARLESETGLIAAPSVAADQPLDPAENEGEAAAAWLTTPPAAPRGEMGRDRMLLDLMPVGVLIYRLDRLIYANPAFLAHMNYPTLAALEDAGGLDTLQVEPDVSTTSSASDGGTTVTISANDKAGDGALRAPASARLHAINWNDEPAHALIFAPAKAEPAAPVATPEPVVAEPLPAGHIDAEDLAAILDTMAEGVVMFDAEGNINSCNRSAEALFGYDGELLTQRNVVDLFAHESRRNVADYLDSVKQAGAASLLDHGREALGQVRAGGLVPLSMIIGRTRAAGPNFFAVFRDLTQIKKTETELLNARRQADRSATAKADVLARISHEVRTPLNAIIGFADVMIDQRFGPLGNERYGEYLRDIRTSGERVIAIVNDLLDLSRIETGKIDLAFSTQNLNEMVEQCVAVMQPQANRSRIIIRTSLSHLLPTIVADARALRQITLNLIGNSIHLANAGGQVIVSTALSDQGDVVLRVRDTGHGLNENEVAAALEPFRSSGPSDTESAGVSLSLTKALVEANHARFQIKSAPSSGTLIEVVFSNAASSAINA
ncbi:PAS domain-containing protein [Tardiphaga sp.]|jgi:PAS domain S-box-containing protein|uniref:PAS domain-containing protein n=1 Tax=Tardiphaga sp. TaxID=1926292 RepID=UPI0037DA36B1